MLFDCRHRLFAVCVGRIQDPEYIRAADRAHSFLLRHASCSGSSSEHSRGSNFTALNFGLYRGTGTAGVYELAQSQGSARVVEQIKQNADMRRLAGHMSGKHRCDHYQFSAGLCCTASFRLWHPKIYQYYQDRLSELYRHSPEFHPPFPNSIFPSATVNLGRTVRCHRHRDVNNLSWGLCSVMALGRFNHKAGSHLILHEPRVVIEFPHGTHINFPSASITHSNTPTAAGGLRLSFTQYAAGPIFRFIQNGFRTEDQLAEEDPIRFSQLECLKKTGWADGLAKFPIPADIFDYQN